ncbi:MAG TPA: SDR family oxidoreductase, partial [Vicinamibacterales bacterium]
MATYTITGGAGFIGSHLVEEVLRRGHAVRDVDNLSTGRRENLPAAPAVEVMVGDVSDPAVARRATAGANVVLHQAAIPSVPRSVEDPASSHRANVEGTLQILIAARDAGVARLVFAGSSSVYGNAAALPKREDMRPHPLSPYALQKLVGEEYCRLFTELYGLETVVTRYFNVFGPRQNPGSPYSGVISLFIDAMLAGRSPRIYGDGEQSRDFTYVDDVVHGVLLAAERPGVAGRVLNVAAGGRVSLLDVISALQTILQTTVDPILGPPRAGDVRHSTADISEARRLLGFEPRTTFADGLRHT